MAPPSARSIRDDEMAAFVDVQRTAMLFPPADDDIVEVRRRIWPAGRCIGAFDESGAMCGSARAFATRLRVPGGAVDAAAVSSVGVLPTHRRQGHLTRMMRLQLADVAERGEPVAILIAAEWSIYGRYGYGPAIDACTLRLDADGARFREPPTGRTALVDAKAFHEAMVDVYARAWERTPGHITWEPFYFEASAGLMEVHDGDDEARRREPKVVWYDGDGVAQGVVSYRLSGDWVDNRPRGGLSTSTLAAATDEAERELFRYLASVDWVSTVRSGPRPVDDAVPLHLVDGRHAVRDDLSDSIWLRVVDVAAALGARTYAGDGALVLEVTDPQGLTGGRFALEVGDGGATCTPTDRPADVTAPVGALSAAYLGGQSWSRLAAAGWVDEHTPGAVARASALFATPRAPWCATGF